MWLGRYAIRNVLLRRQFSATASVTPLLEDLAQRGFIQDATRRDVLAETLQTKKHCIYAGVDPTAKSLHIGHLIPLLTLLHFHIRGHHIIPLIGGATGRVGDPSGRIVERGFADLQQVDDNAASLTASIQSFFKNSLIYANSRLTLDRDIRAEEPRVVNNFEWHKSLTLLDFLHKVGGYVRINTMLNRESVSARLSSQQGLSFTEFTYQLLQAYDFYHLNQHFGCTIQVGGSDQWGNIVAGLELIGKMADLKAPDDSAAGAFGITTPLLTTSTGEKFGKSAGNAVWLDPTLTSIFDFYQYFLKVTDADVGKYLRLFTFMALDEIEEVIAAHNACPENRLAQSRLAAEVTEMVHLKSGVQQAVTKTKLLFASDYTLLKVEDVVSAFHNDPRLVKTSLLHIQEMPLGKLAAQHGLVSSNSASRALISSGGLYINGQPITNAQTRVAASDLLDGRMIILRAGKDKILILVATEQ